MNKLLFILLLLPCSLFAQTQMYRPVICFEAKNIDDVMSKRLGEELSYYGVDIDLGTNVEWYENKMTGTWTLLERKNDNICIIATGERGKRS